MKLLIDNLDEQGALDYSANMDVDGLPQIRRRLNTPAELQVSLLAESCAFLVPVVGARIVLLREDGAAIFTGYVPSAPEPEYLGWGEQGPAFRYRLRGIGDEFLLDRKRFPGRAPWVHRSAGEALRQSVTDLLPAVFDVSAVQELDVLPSVSSNAQRPWSEHAAEIALRARASYRAHDSRIVFSPIGAVVHSLAETSPGFEPAGLKVRSNGVCRNDLVVTGHMEPDCFVHDYFLGDGLTRSFSLSHAPFTSYGAILLDEEYKAALLPLDWTLDDATGAISVSGGKLDLNGGRGDGLTTLCFAEKVEVGGGVLLQHGEATFSAASDGVIGGLYAAAISVAGCLAGFRISPSGSQSTIRALVNGAVTGATITTVTGHRYALTTRIYATEVFREREIFHSGSHPAGSGRGGGAVAADARIVLELRDINPADPATLAAPSTVLYDGVIAAVPGFCTYALVNSINLHGALSFTRLRHITEAEVRTALPSAAFRTRLVGDFSEGAECSITTGPDLLFCPEYVPALNERIVVRYRSRGRSLARVQDTASIATLARGDDDGVRAEMRTVEVPGPRTSVDCENAALALLDDGGSPWSGEYACWSDALPGAASEIWPGDALAVSLPSHAAEFSAIVREIQIEAADLSSDLCRYAIHFANDAALPLAISTSAARLTTPPEVTATVETAGSTCIADLPAAEVTAIASTTVTIDAGGNPPAGGGFEVRRTDSGWGAEADRNLVGRFTSRSFTVTRISREVDFYIRQYDASSPRRYSRCSTALHVDYPL